ncbi:MAG: hypothetical protein ABSA75_13305 [Candidatus Bathyarchaeia archaeon]|jgi:hypothetical protein
MNLRGFDVWYATGNSISRGRSMAVLSRILLIIEDLIDVPQKA